MEKNEILSLGKKMFLLLAAYLQGEKKDFSVSEEETKKLLDLANDNGVLIVTYLACKSQGIALNKEMEEKLSKLTSMNLRKTLLFEEERKKLYSFLNENSVAYLPLKGIVFNKLYKDYGSRQFADNDILFDKAYDKQVRDYFLAEGYEIESYGKGYHDAYEKKPFFNFEMHRELFEESTDEPTIQGFLKYFKGYLNKGKAEEGSQRSLSNEDTFIYFMAHFYKHLSQSGCGARSLLDVKVYLDKHPDMDWEYIYGEFRKISLDGFELKAISLTTHLFAGEALSQEEEETFLSMLSNGLYGNVSNMIKHSLKQGGSKAKYVFRRIFPRMSFYKSYYPWFYKTKVFIPLAWFLRCFHVFKKKEMLKEELKELKKAE